jgi:mono/diheme cytochrome c family protein
MQRSEDPCAPASRALEAKEKTNPMTTPRIQKSLWMCVAAAALLACLAPLPAFAGDAEAGKTLYTVNCLACHGATGKGDGVVGLQLKPPPRDFSAAEFQFDTDGDGQKGTDADLRNVIMKGGAAFGGSPLMAPWPVLSEADVANLVAYIRKLAQ